MNYDVDVNGCKAISSDVATDMKEYVSANKDMGKATQQAAKDSKSGIVAKAISGYVEHAFNDDLTSISTLTNNARSGLDKALTYVHAGDHDMAHTSISSLGKSEGAGADAPGHGRGAGAPKGASSE